LCLPTYGYYVVSSLQQISSGQQGKFWPQDDPGLVGTERSNSYGC
jgi:hypothetical protein